MRVEVGSTDKLCVRQVKLRLAQQCRERYELLLAALQASRCQAHPAAALPATSMPSASLARPGPVSAAALPALAAVSAASQAPGNMSQAGPSQSPSPAGSAAGAAAGTRHPTSMPGDAAATTGLPAGGQAVTSMAMQTPAPSQPGSVPAVAGPPHSAHGGAPLLGRAPTQAQPTQQAPGGVAAQQSSERALNGSAQAGLPGQQRPEAKSAGAPGGPGQAWSLAAGLETVREHLAWLATSNIVCSPEVSQALA